MLPVLMTFVSFILYCENKTFPQITSKQTEVCKVKSLLFPSSQTTMPPHALTHTQPDPVPLVPVWCGSFQVFSVHVHFYTRGIILLCNFVLLDEVKN